ncbi:MAG: DUF1080 domain-containing protein [Candidatus Marinimicrobia bacterium]|nr:DUF1080 domain-containing protein [Candidatus Neomarinimicrobiota bacterium]
MYNKTQKSVLRLFSTTLIIFSWIVYSLHTFIPAATAPASSTNDLILHETLFNGIDLSGWKVHGTERWYVESGELICESGPDHEYGYLSTIKSYKDFDLSLLFKQESDGNSGVFFRTTFEGTRISGWQVEVAPKGHDTGGVYESYGRGWLVTIPDDEENILADGAWNKLRVRVIGDHVQTWLNGIKMADIHDDIIGKGIGSIALQIHSGDNVKVRWRDIQLSEFLDVSSTIRDFKTAKPNEQIQLIVSLTPFANDPKVTKIIRSSLKSKYRDLRISALKAAGHISNPQIVNILAKHASKSADEEKETARHSLYHLEGKGINDKILSGLSSFFMRANVKIELIRATREREIHSGAKQIIALASKRNDTIRMEAVNTLRVIAGEENIHECIRLLEKARTNEERNELERTVTYLANLSSATNYSSLLIKSMQTAQFLESQLSFIRILGEIKNDSTLSELTPLLTDSSPRVQSTVISALSGWINDKPLSALMVIIETTSDPDQKQLAIRGAVRLLGVKHNRSMDETVRLYQSVLSYANNNDDKKALLAGLHDVQSFEALEMAEQFLDNKGLMSDAETACISIANNIYSIFPEECKTIMLRIINTSEAASQRRSAQTVLNKIEVMDDYITQWLMSEPFTVTGKSLYSTKFAPELSDDTYPLWRSVPEFSDKNNYWHVDLSALKTSLMAAIYLKTNIWSEIDQSVRLEMGSNDGIKAWMNNELVHLNPVARGVIPGQDVVEVKLIKGQNTLLLKIVNEGGGGWGGCARFRRLDGGHLSNVKIDLQSK